MRQRLLTINLSIILAALLLTSTGVMAHGPDPQPTEEAPVAPATQVPATTAPTTAAVSTVAPAPTAVSSGNSATYTVLPGETLFRIAVRFRTTVKVLAEANGIANPSL